jgi:hypothetical protein
MIRPSEKSLSLAEELIDYVHPGMSRAAALHEVAHMVDDMNAELVEAVGALLANPGATRESNEILLSHLRRVLAEYKPWRMEVESQHELFASNTQTGTQSPSVAGQMP